MADKQGEFWLKQSFESEYAYGAFAIYREMGPSRRLRKAAGIFYNREDLGPEDHQLSQFKRWSAQHMWTARTEAHDAEQEALLLQRMQGYRLESVEAHHRICAMYLQILSKKGLDLLRGEDDIRPSTLPALISAVSHWHRLVLGESTEKLEMAEDPDERVADYSQLDDQEITQLDDLLRKVYGSLD